MQRRQVERAGRGVPQDGDAHGGRDSRIQELEPLRIELRRQDADSCYVAFRAGQVRNVPFAGKIVCPRNDGRCRCRLPGRLDRRSTNSHNRVKFQLRQLRRKIRLKITPLDSDILAFEVTEIT